MHGPHDRHRGAERAGSGARSSATDRRLTAD